MSKIISIKDLDDMGVIKWRLTDVCNYHCSYCIRRPLADEGTLMNDMVRCITAIPGVQRIAKELNEINNKKVKIDLIGGEITLFNQLSMILAILYSCDYIEKINITTNLSRDIGYYKELANVAKNKNKKLTMTASFHYEFTELDKFMEKAKVMNELLGTGFKCETVITKDNKYIDEFIKKCDEIGCRYMCEEDLLDKTKRGQTVRNYKVGNRYEVTMDNGEKLLYTTRNEVVKTYGEEGIGIDTAGMQCTRDHDYVYIEKNTVIPCRSKCLISDYHVSENLRSCTFGKCTLCGHMSIKK